MTPSNLRGLTTSKTVDYLLLWPDDFLFQRATWAPILHAASIWFSQGGGLENISSEKVELDVTGKLIFVQHTNNSIHYQEAPT